MFLEQKQCKDRNWCNFFLNNKSLRFTWINHNAGVLNKAKWLDRCALYALEHTKVMDIILNYKPSVRSQLAKRN